MELSILDDIYECALSPTHGPKSSPVSPNGRARTGWMMISSQDKHQCLASNPLAKMFLEPMVSEGVVANSDRFARLCRAERPGFLRERDVYTDAELEIDPFYAKYIYPRGAGHAAATTFVLPTQERILVSLERDKVRGPVEDGAIARLDELRPHVARAAAVAARLRLQSAISATATLAALGLPAAAFDEQGKTLVANELLQRVEQIAIWGAFDRLALVDKTADRQLRDAIAQLDAADSATVQSFPVRDKGGRAIRIAHVVPFRGSARDVFSRGFALLALWPVASLDAPPIELGARCSI